MRIPRFVALVVCLVVVSCSASTSIVPSTSDAGNAGTATGTAAEAGAELSSQAVYESIENSVVFLLTPDGVSSGSGIVIDGGWILTNAHVVDRFTEMRVGRSDGEDLGLHPVHAVDWVFDLALIAPVDDVSLVPMERSTSAQLAIGSRILLIGFPDEESAAPTPTLTEGIVTRRRFVALGDFPFLQVDATIAPGQSGGALVDGNGSLMGISGLEFGEGEFGLVFEADAMWPRIDELLAEPRQTLPNGESVFEAADEIGPLRNFGFTVDVGESGSLDFVAESPHDIYIDVQTLGGATVSRYIEAPDPFGSAASDDRLFVDEQIEGGENVIATVEPGTYQVVVGSFGPEPATVTINSANPIRRFADPEEGEILPTGVVVEGGVDWALDSDRWLLPVEEGQQVSILADGIADTVLAVRRDGVIIATSDDEGLGLFGSGSLVEFTAETTGTYEVEVGSFDTTRWGYLIQATVE